MTAATRDAAAATVEVRPPNSIEFEIENPPTFNLGGITPEQPIYLVAVNPWQPWVARTAGVAIGTITATLATLLLNLPAAGWAIATSITTALLYAWVAAGYELTERHPKKFKQAV